MPFFRALKEFPLGRAPLAMALLCVASVPFLPRRHADPPGTRTLHFWIFANAHYNDYRKRVPLFERENPGVHVDLQLLPTNELADRLMASFLSGTGAPDLVEVEIGTAGRFFLGGDSDIGFRDLTPRLKSEGWYGRLVPARFVPWSAHGRIYGVPHDIHPCVLLYREDLLQPLGIDLPREVATWDDFLRVFSWPGVLDPRRDGRRTRFAIMLSKTDAGQFRPLLLQRGGDLFDAAGHLTIDTPIAADTLRWYRDLFDRVHVALPQPPFGPDLYGPMKENRLFCVLAPDWFIGSIKQFAPELSGRWRAMPLPAWAPGGRRTTTLGGTMIGMSKQCSRPDLAWNLLRFLYFDRPALANRYRETNIIPPLRAAWTDPVFRQPDPYLGGQPLGELLTSLAPSIPPVRQDEYSTEALYELGKALYRCLSDPSLSPKTALGVPQRALEARIARDRFRETDSVVAVARPAAGRAARSGGAL